MMIDRQPVLGVIMLDTVFPRIPGDIGNPKTFDFPVAYECVSGATATRVVYEAAGGLLEPFVTAARQLESRGVKMISTSCGFLAMYQQELSESVNVPVLSSSLLQLHAAKSVLKQGQKVGVLTVSSEALGECHFSAVGAQIDDYYIAGMPPDSEFVSVFVGNKQDLDEEVCLQEMVSAAKLFVATYPDIGAIVLECTNMPPYANAIRKATRLPVYDVVSMINYVHSCLLV